MINRSCLYPATLTLLLAACGSGGGGSTSVMPPPPQGPVITALHDVQGAGNSSPMTGTTITVNGVVTGDFQSGDADSRQNLNGFFIQEEVPDAAAGTSDGLFVFDGSAPTTDVNVGDIVQVEGEVLEYFGETQISATSVKVTGNGTVQAVDISFPFDVTGNSSGNEIADLERYEGMLVRVPEELTVVSLFNLERYGEVQLAANGRWFEFSNQMAPDVSGYAAHRRQFAAASFVLDDGQSSQNVRPIRYLIPDPLNAPDYSIRIGDTVAGLTGNIRYSRGSGSSGDEVFRLVPQSEPVFVNDNPRDTLAPVVGGELKIATLNVLNFFTSIDTGQSICGPGGNSACRGADSSMEFNRQRGKILTALTMLDADIVGLIELENNVSESIQSLVDGLNSLAGSSTWSFIDTGVIGNSVIRVGLIYKTTTVSPVGTYAVLDSNVDARFLDAKNRPILLQTFAQRSNNGRVNLVVSHLKSKGSSCDSIGDPDLVDGQGNCNVTRTSAIQALVDWLDADPTGNGDPDNILIGDLNAYLEEDPLTALKAAGFFSLLDTQVGPTAYSFQFRGYSGALDHALVSASLMNQVSGASEWHINADEPPVLDYNLEFGRNEALFDPASPFRASDHDPLLIGLSLDPD
jgi:uncharacterized protein